MAPVRVTRSFHTIVADKREVQLRVFTPDTPDGPPKPAVVMVCGLLWLGEGFLGRIGLAFNDSFGYTFARHGVPCVQIHTPSRHIAHTRLMDFAAMLLWPLSWIPILSLPLLCADVLMLSITLIDVSLLILVPFLSFLGPLSLPMLHLAVRSAQWLQGSLPPPEPSTHQKEVAAAVAWAKAKQQILRSDGRLVLCGYSSGGQCAALYALSPAAPRFHAVVLISGIYSLQTQAWTGWRRLLTPIFNALYGDILGVTTDESRRLQSPEVMVEQSVQGQDWYVLTAKMELMGLQPFEDILFNGGQLCTALEGKGASVHRVQCGLNHWLLVLRINDFIQPFCASLIKST
mmetsp:Transcript_49730/g.144286  ORF Transcript_49730/g.144286 Transcript_49730/m.144286 type:complete len:345 (-) Transcript_49730:108-1142(-)